MKISTILATKGAKVITVQANQSLHEAVKLLAQHRIGALVVVDDQTQLVGIISERDVVQAVAQQVDALVQPIGAFMTQSVITATPQDDVRSVMRTMTERRFRHLPIIDQGQLAGIISIGDVVKAQLDEDEGEIDSLQNSV